MLKAVVTASCVALMAVAAVLVARLRHTQRTPSPLTGSESFRERLTVAAGRAGGMLAGAFLAGVLTIGADGRLMMRILAATSPDDVQGLRTEADEIIGEVTAGGSMVLIASVGIGAGVAGLAIVSVLRRWLPTRSLVAGLIGCAIGAGLLVRPAGLLTADSSDFTLVAPVSLAVVLCLASLALFGATFGVLVDWFAPRWPRPGWSPHGVASMMPFALLLPVPPVFVGALVAVLIGAVVPRLRARSLERHPAGLGAEGGGVGRGLVIGLGGLGACRWPSPPGRSWLCDASAGRAVSRFRPGRVVRRRRRSPTLR